MIQGVKTKQLKTIPDNRGRLMEILRSDDDIFIEFGQVYMTTVLPHTTKAWHWHIRQYDLFTCVSGCIRLALYDNREGSSTRSDIMEFEISQDNPLLVRVPPGVYHGFKCIGDKEAIIINTVTQPYNHETPDEYRVDAYENDIDYDWRK